MLVVGADQMDEVRTFLAGVAGFEEERVWRDGEQRVALVGYRYGPSRLQVAIPGSLPDLPPLPSAPAVLTFTVQDATSLHGVLRGRAGDAVGPLRELGAATAFTVHGPEGIRLMFLTYREESPRSFGDLEPEG